MVLLPSNLKQSLVVAVSEIVHYSLSVSSKSFKYNLKGVDVA
jgi:hypothetical protein